MIRLPIRIIRFGDPRLKGTVDRPVRILAAEEAERVWAQDRARPVLEGQRRGGTTPSDLVCVPTDRVRSNCSRCRTSYRRCRARRSRRGDTDGQLWVYLFWRPMGAQRTRRSTPLLAPLLGPWSSRAGTLGERPHVLHNVRASLRQEDNSKPQPSSRRQDHRRTGRLDLPMDRQGHRHLYQVPQGNPQPTSVRVLSGTALITVCRSGLGSRPQADAWR